MSYKYEFPDYDCEMPTLEGFTDASWHNDACPSMERKLYSNSYIKVWCDYKDASMREIGGDQYTVTHYYEDTFDFLPMFSSDDIEEVKKFIAQFFKLNGKE